MIVREPAYRERGHYLITTAFICSLVLTVFNMAGGHGSDDKWDDSELLNDWNAAYEEYKVRPINITHFWKPA
jgi:hypothetical protein